MEIATEKLIAKDNQSTVESSNVTVEQSLLEGRLSRASSRGRKKLPRKCVKDMIYHNSCRSSSVSGMSTSLFSVGYLCAHQSSVMFLKL